MEIPLLAIFYEIHVPCSKGSLARFGTTLKICKKSNYDQNHLKFSTQPGFYPLGGGGKVLPIDIIDKVTRIGNFRRHTDNDSNSCIN